MEPSSSPSDLAQDLGYVTEFSIHLDEARAIISLTQRQASFHGAIWAQDLNGARCP